ncbi:MAG: ABC transporter substrate-binding protein [Clostridiales bacterium]|jgi:iron complex transport system substrate-binding protein|nr:ABC transporter substrate-binding protein [Clostridiales bacterium]
MIRKIIALLICLALAAGCSRGVSSNTVAPPQTSAAQEQDEYAAQSSAMPEQSAGPVTVTDMKGRAVTLSAPAARIVALTAADCEILYALGAGELLVGRGEYCDYPAEVLDAPAVQSGMETNLEQIIALKPQVLLMAAMAQSTEQLEPLENAGIQSVVSDAQDIEGVYTAIQLIGNLTGRQSRSEELIENMKSSFAAVSVNAEANKGKTIYFEVSPLAYGLWAAGDGTFMNEVAEMLGLTNCFADVSGWGEISEEQVIARNPDYIVTVGMYSGQGLQPDEEILGRPGWENVEAVRNKAVLNLSGNELSRPSYRLAEGAELLNDFVAAHRAKPE